MNVQDKIEIFNQRINKQLASSVLCANHPTPLAFITSIPLSMLYESTATLWKFKNTRLRENFLVLLKEVMELYSHIFVLTSIDSEKFPEPAFVKAATRIEYNVSNSNPERTAIFSE